ncbi:MAG TPA: tRNA-dihydrouridine synthase family protein [Polyangiaceae bacterium]|nr:tRNA-dihydrouridine synthase family protein [Polyangiaceae bacterium]
MLGSLRAFAESAPVTALAPMQYITDAPFIRTIAHYGAPDLVFTEYFRVHAQSRLERHILETIAEHGEARPIFAQMIGEDPEALARTARELSRFAVAGIDLNLGCPAPLIYRKNVGGGLLRDPEHVNRILGTLRQAIPGVFTVKMRIGFDSTQNFEPILKLVSAHSVDLLTVHGRTVKEMYHATVHYAEIRRAVQQVSCPVLANGEVSSAEKARWVLHETGARGVMIGRHAIRNPWIFSQCRELFAGRAPMRPTLADVREYIERLYFATRAVDALERSHVTKLKKYLNFVGLGVDPAGQFLHAMRRASSERELFTVCDEHLLREPTTPFAPEPFPNLHARPRCEAGAETSGDVAAAEPSAELESCYASL